MKKGKTTKVYALGQLKKYLLLVFIKKKKNFIH